LDAIDLSITGLLIGLRSPALDAVSRFLIESDLRIGVLATLLFYTWVAPNGSWVGREERVARACAGIVLAMVMCFVARHVFAQHPRPRLILPLDFPPVGANAEHLVDTKAFPSDTACLAAAVTVTIFLVSRRLGWFAVAWSLLVVCFPRAYIGYHYVSDLMAGAIIGGTFAWAASFPRLLPLGALPRMLRDWHRKHPALAVVALALVAHQIGAMFPLLQRVGGALRVW
jgi:undecaprenyl-diphosphatase